MLHMPRPSNGCSLEIPIKDTFNSEGSFETAPMKSPRLWQSTSDAAANAYSRDSTEFPMQTHRLCQPVRSTIDFFFSNLYQDSSKGLQALRGSNPALSNEIVMSCLYFSLKAQLHNQVIKLMCICWLYLSTCNTCIGYDKPIRLF